jgi:hypothetical protein
MLEDFQLLLLHDNARHHNANKINETLQNFKSTPGSDSNSKNQGLVKRWDKCLNVQGDYVEK